MAAIHQRRRRGTGVCVSSAEPERRGDFQPRKSCDRLLCGTRRWRPGDLVEIRRGHIFINGTALDEPYITALSKDSSGPGLVLTHSYYVLGDNRSASSDSRLRGPIPEEASCEGHGSASGLLISSELWRHLRVNRIRLHAQLTCDHIRNRLFRLQRRFLSPV